MCGDVLRRELPVLDFCNEKVVDELDVLGAVGRAMSVGHNDGGMFVDINRQRDVSVVVFREIEWYFGG